MFTPFLRSALLVASLAMSLSATAQVFPDKPIRLVVPFGPGTVTDQYARALATGMTQLSNQPVIVDNRPGASGFLGTQQVKTAQPDGYTVLIATNTTHAANEFLFKKLPYDPVKDFSPVAMLGVGSSILVINSASPAKNLAEFIALAKSQPGKLTFGNGGATTLVAAEQFMEKAGVKMVNVPYKSNPLALTDLLGGQIDMVITDTATGIPQVRAGKLRALGVTTKTRSPLAPDVPSLQEAGLKDYELTFWFAAYAPAGTPLAVVNRLNEFFVKAAKMPAAEAFHKVAGTEAITTTPDGLARFQVVEAQKWNRMIKSAGIQPE
jgi:tripartite-type tricarboxylate transporter receptor subunit TctC